MKRKIITALLAMGMMASGAIAADGKALTKNCSACHGNNFEKSALGKSSIVNGQSYDAILESLRGYKAGTLNKNGLGNLMKGQASKYSDKDLKAIASYISGLKSINSDISSPSPSLSQAKIEHKTLTETSGIYEGDVVNGLKHGKGTYKWNNGDAYIGDWINGDRTGYGLYTWSNGRSENSYFIKGEQVTQERYNQIRNGEAGLGEWKSIPKNWIKDNKGCYHFNWDPKSSESLSWTGGCKDGYANGFGVRRWSGSSKDDGSSNILLVKGVNPDNYIESSGTDNREVASDSGWRFADYIVYYKGAGTYSFDMNNMSSYITKITNEGFKGTLTHGKMTFYVGGYKIADYDGDMYIDTVKKYSEISNGQSGDFTLWDGSRIKMKVTKVPSCFFLNCSGYYSISKDFTQKSSYYTAAETERDSYYNQQQQAQNARYEQFRKNLQDGDETSSGLVVQVKGNLVKIQTNDSQCSQRDYKGNCSNYINTPVEKWLKRSEIYPK